MSYVRLALSEWLKWMISISLIFTPFYGMPVAAQQAPATPAPAAPSQEVQSIHSQIEVLSADLDDLVDRAYFPDIPRTTGGGAPSATEIGQARTKIGAIREDFQNHFNEILSQSDILDFMRDINGYFSAVQNLEGIKIALGQDSHPENWDVDYRLTVPLEGFSQVEFLQYAALNSEAMAALPTIGLSIDQVKNPLEQVNFQTHLDNVNGRWMIRLTVNPSFAADFERLNYVNNPSQRNVFQFALQVISHQLYESAAIVHLLRGLSLDSLPQPSAFIRRQFVSMRVARAQLQQRDRRRVAVLQKPKIFKAILDYMDTLYKSGKGWILDDNFLRTYFSLTGLRTDESTIRQQVEEVRKSELKAFNLALFCLLNMADPSSWSAQAPDLILQAKLLALRWIYIVNPDTHLNEHPDAAAKLTQIIEQRARQIVAGITSEGTLSSQLQQIAGANDLPHLRAQQRSTLQTNLQKAAESIRDFSSQKINIGYLVAVEQGYFDSLKLNPYVDALVELLKSQSSYRSAYDKYREELYAYLEGFKFPSQPAGDLTTLKGVFASYGKLVWNPAGLQGKASPEYINAMTVDSRNRLKDLADMVRVGQALKFDKFEAQHNPKRHGILPAPTVDNLLKENFFSWLLGSEKQAYQKEVKRDVLTNAPLLGGEVRAMDGMGNNLELGMLWQYLISPDYTDAQKSQYVDQQLAATESLVQDNMALIDNQMAQLNAAGSAPLAGAGETLRTLVVRASAINAGLSSFAGFGSYYQEMRDQLLLPGLVGRQWQQFSTWANTATTYMLAIFALQFFGPWVATAGKASDALSGFLAPIFGARFAHLNAVILGFIGITLSSDAIKGYGTEAYRKTILQRFFECGTTEPCVATYSDVAYQNALASHYRSNFIVNLLSLGAIYLGLRLTPFIAAKVSTWNADRRLTRLVGYLKVFGLTGDSQLGRSNVLNAAEAEVQKAQSIADPVERMKRQLEIQRARVNFESAVNKDTLSWIGQNERFRTAADRLGLTQTKQDWKSLANLANAWGNLEARYAAGQVSSGEYQELMQSIYDMYQSISPVWQQMSRSAFTRNYMQRVWNESNRSSRIQISTEMDEFDRLNQDFSRRMAEYAGGDLSRPQLVNGRFVEGKPPVPNMSGFEKLIARLGNVMEKAPQDRSRIQRILEAFRNKGNP